MQHEIDPVISALCAGMRTFSHTRIHPPSLTHSLTCPHTFSHIYTHTGLDGEMAPVLIKERERKRERERERERDLS